MSEPLLRIRNHHTPACGDPPIIDGNDPDVYLGYFENRFGEQWIFKYNRKTMRGELLGGDIGWNHRHEVVGGMVPGVILNRDESMWLATCWSAVTQG